MLARDTNRIDILIGNISVVAASIVYEVRAAAFVCVPLPNQWQSAVRLDIVRHAGQGMRYRTGPEDPANAWKLAPDGR